MHTTMQDEDEDAVVVVDSSLLSSSVVVGNGDGGDGGGGSFTRMATTVDPRSEASNPYSTCANRPSSVKVVISRS